MKFAYQLPPQDMKRLTPVSFDSCPLALWRLLAQQGLLQMFLKHKNCAQGVEVCLVEAAAPIVFQARALKDFAEGQLVLVPYVEGAPRVRGRRKDEAAEVFAPTPAVLGDVHGRGL